MLSIHCKTGKIQVTDNGMIQIAQTFGQIIWQAPCASVIGFTTQPGMLTAITVIIQTTQGSYTAETVTKANFAKLQALFPNLQTQVAGKEWYHHPTILTHIATYENERQLQKDMEAAAHHGWQVQGQSASGGQVSAAKIIAGGIIAGPLGALAGSGRSKKKITITFMRSQEWLARNRQ